MDFCFYSQVGESLETELSGFSVPLEHSFELGKKCFNLLRVS